MYQSTSVLCVCTIITLVVSGVVGQTQCPIAPKVPEDRRIDKTILRIATYNAEWLFWNRYNCPGTGCPWATETDAQLHLQAVAEEIVQINADILNMAEVQDCTVLQALIKFMPSTMGYLPYLVTGTDTATGQNVALLTRIDPVVSLNRTSNRVIYPVPGSKCGDDATGSTAVSKHYYTHFNVTGLSKPLSIFGLHLLAFPDRTDRCVQREAQARVISNLVASEAIARGHSVVVLGDFNDFDPTIVDASDNKPISSVLNILRDPVQNTPGDELTNVAKFILSSADIYSCWYDRDSNCKTAEDEFSLIDHVLISNDLVPLIDKSWADHSYGPSCVTVESDHWPVLVQLTTTNIKVEAPFAPSTASPSGANYTPNNLKFVFLGVVMIVGLLVAVSVVTKSTRARSPYMPVMQ